MRHHKPFGKTEPARVRRQTRRAVRAAKAAWLDRPEVLAFAGPWQGAR